jgi:TPM domain
LRDARACIAPTVAKLRRDRECTREPDGLHRCLRMRRDPMMINVNTVIAIRHHTFLRRPALRGSMCALALLTAACTSKRPARDESAVTAPPPAPAAAPLPAAPTTSADTRRHTPKLVDITIPKLTARVNDYAKLLPKSDVTRLEQKLAEHERATGQQFALLIVPSLNGVEAADFGFTVAQHWKLGRKDHDDGLLLLVAPAERQVDIEVGVGLEPRISDALAASVIREQLGPAFREQKFGAGLNDAFNRLMTAARAHTVPP